MGELSVTLGVIGTGSMGGAIGRGLIEAGVLAPSRLLVCDHHPESLAPFDELGARTFDTDTALVEADPEVVVLAVKPQVIGAVMGRLSRQMAGRLVISIAAGVPVATLERALPAARVVRAMPNLPVQVRSGATALCRGSRATDEDVELACALFTALGAVSVMREDQLDVAGAVSGCAPAYFSLFVDALARAGVEAGLPAACAREMAASTMRGCAEQLLNEGVHPREYMERVTSPGGTTAAALRALEGPLMEGTYAAVDAALARTRELAES